MLAYRSYMIARLADVHVLDQVWSTLIQSYIEKQWEMTDLHCLLISHLIFSGLVII